MLNEAQLKARLGKITSSVAAGALGLNPRMSPLDAWMRVTGRIPPMAPNKAIRRGNKLEQLVLDYPAEELGLVRTPAPFRQHPEMPWAGDSADALYFSGDYADRVRGLGGDELEAAAISMLRDGIKPLYLGEGKTVAGGAARSYGEEGSDDVHPGTLVQSHWHLLHWPEVAKHSCIVPVLVGGYAFEFRLYYVDGNDEFASGIREDLERWHRDYVVADKPPPASQPDDTAHLLSLFPRPTQGLAAPTAELEMLARDKDAAKLDKEAAEAREEAAKLRLRELLGDFEGAKGSGWAIRYKPNKPSIKTDWEAIARELCADDALIAKHTTEKPGNRPLVITIK